MTNDSPYPGIPSWLKVFGIAVVVLIILVVVVVVSGVGGEHGPGRHSGGAGNPPETAVPEGHTPRVGGH